MSALVRHLPNRTTHLVLIMESSHVASVNVLRAGKERTAPVPRILVLWVPMGGHAVEKALVCVDSVYVTLL